MEIRFIPEDYRDELNNGDIESIPKDYLNSFVSDFNESNTPSKFEIIDYNVGPDYNWVYAVIATAISTIALGEQINKGLDGWIEVGKKLKRLIGKADNIALDNDALTVICVNKSIELIPNTESIKKVIEYETDTPAAYSYGGKCEFSDFIEKAEVYYVQGYEINNSHFILLGITQNGEVEILKQAKITKNR